jgi:hypothetical protein
LKRKHAVLLVAGVLVLHLWLLAGTPLWLNPAPGEPLHPQAMQTRQIEVASPRAAQVPAAKAPPIANVNSCALGGCASPPSERIRSSPSFRIKSVATIVTNTAARESQLIQLRMVGGNSPCRPGFNSGSGNTSKTSKEEGGYWNLTSSTKKIRYRSLSGSATIC